MLARVPIQVPKSTFAFLGAGADRKHCGVWERDLIERPRLK